MSAYDAPLSLPISLPEGVTKLDKTEGTRTAFRQMRFHPGEIETIEHAAKILGITSTQLIRHCALKYSLALIRHRTNWIKEKADAAKERNSS